MRKNSSCFRPLPPVRIETFVRAVGCFGLMTSGLVSARAFAQVGPPSTTPVAASTGSQATTDAPTTGLALSLVVSKIAKAANIQIIMDTASSNALVMPSGRKTTTENFEQQIDGLVAQMPSGTTWAKLYLPDIPGKTYSGDDLADYALAESKVFGAVGGALPPGTIEVMGQRIGADKAAPIITALNLKPIYLIVNPSPAKNVGGMTQQQWAVLTPDQKQQFAQGQAQLLMSLDPGQRSQALAQMFGQAAAVASAMIQSLPPAEQKQFIQGIFGSLGLGASPPGGAPAPRRLRRDNNCVHFYKFPLELVPMTKGPQGLSSSGGNSPC